MNEFQGPPPLYEMPLAKMRVLLQTTRQDINTNRYMT